MFFHVYLMIFLFWLQVAWRNLPSRLNRRTVPLRKSSASFTKWKLHVIYIIIVFFGTIARIDFLFLVRLSCRFFLCTYFRACAPFRVLRRKKNFIWFKCVCVFVLIACMWRYRLTLTCAPLYLYVLPTEGIIDSSFQDLVVFFSFVSYTFVSLSLTTTSIVYYRYWRVYFNTNYCTYINILAVWIEIRCIHLLIN